MKKNIAAVALALGGVLAAPLAAHHSFASTYLEDAPPVTIEGKLVQFLLRNPHSFVHVEAKDPKTGEMLRWSIEWGAAGQLAQQGVGQGALKVGDMVKVTGSPARNPADNRLRMRSITRPSDGWNWGNQGQTFN
jgi:hypothetical protein